MRKLTSLLLSVAMVLFLGPALRLTGAAADGSAQVDYSDVDTGTEYAADILAMTQAGLLTGVGGGRFEPDRGVTRAEAVTVLYRLAGSPEVKASVSFSDVSDDAW